MITEKEIQEMWQGTYSLKLGILGCLSYVKPYDVLRLTIECYNGDLRCNPRSVEIRSMSRIDEFIKQLHSAFLIFEGLKEFPNYYSNSHSIRLTDTISVDRYGVDVFRYGDVQQNNCFTHTVRTKDEMDEIVAVWEKVKLRWVDMIVTHPNFEGQIPETQLVSLLNLVNKRY